MKQLGILLLMVVFGLQVKAQNTDQLIDSYVKVKNALVQDDAKKAAAATLDFQKVVKAEKPFAQKEELTKAVEAMAKAKDLDAQRAAFYKLSDVMWEITKASPKLKKTAYYQYCPMAKGYWISRNKEIENPYHGQSMLKCGKVVETKN